MQAERDVLVRRVFPMLQARLTPCRIRLVEIDLRWGITEQQERNNEVLGLCLQEIDRARPYFIGLLGSRYGSILGSIPPHTIERYPWLPLWETAGASITEMEVIHGVMNRISRSKRALFYLRDPAPLSEVPDSMRAFLSDMPKGSPGDPAISRAPVRLLLERLQNQGVANAMEVLESLLAGNPPSLEIISCLSPSDRLEILKERLRRAGLVNMDGYGWTLLGLRVRWNLARAALRANSSLQRLQAACVNGIITPTGFEQLAGDMEITDFLRRFGTIALGGLDSLVTSVRDSLWNQLCSDPALQERLQSGPGRANVSEGASAEQQKRTFLSFIHHMIPPERIPEQISMLSPEMAEQVLQAGLSTNAVARGEMLRHAKLWNDRRDDGDAETGGLAGNWDDERDGHRRYAEAKLGLYVPRRVPEEAIKKQLLSSTRKLIVIAGPAGSGKSALVAKTARQCRALARCRKGLCIEHYVGATPSSASLLGTLRRLNAELGLIPANQVEQLAADVHDFSESFARAFQKLPADRTCYLIIDALDQMEAEHSAHDLHWLPAVLPDHVQLVLSLATDGQDVSSRRLLAALRLRDAAWIDLADHPLTDADRRSLIERIPSMASKSLEPEHIASLLDNPGTRNPLYLTIALEELRGFGSFELLSARIAQFSEAHNPAELFAQVIDGMRMDFDPEVVRLVLSSLAVSRHGLAESELVDLVVANGGKASLKPELQAEETAALLRYLSPYLQWRGRLLDFGHRSIKEAVEMAYFGDAGVRREMHRCLGAYFERQGRNAQPNWRDVGRRSISEAPYHYIHSGDWDGLLRIFNDDEFVFRKGRSPFSGELANEYALALAIAPEEYATALVIAFVRCASQQMALTDVVRDALMGLARRDEGRFVALGQLFDGRGGLWRSELLKVGAPLIGVRRDQSAETVLEALARSYDGNELPDSSKISMYQQLSTLRNSQGRHDEAMRYAEQGAELAKELGDVINAAILKSAIISVAASLGRHEDAARLVKELFEEATKNPSIDRVLPRVALYGFRSLVEIGRVQDAEKYIREAMELCLRLTKAEHDYAILASLFAQHCILKGKPGEAILPLRMALSWRVSAYPEEIRPNLYSLLVTCLNQMGMMEEAASVVESARTSPWPTRGSEIVDQLRQGHVATTAAGAIPASSENANRLARAMEEKGDWDGAESAYQQGLQAGPQDIILLGNYAFFRQNVRLDLPGAQDLYLRALKVDPSDAINHTNFAGLCLVMGNNAEAEAHLREAWRLVAGKADRYVCRILFLRAALAVLRNEDATLFLGQLKTLFEQGIQPMPSRNTAVRDYLQKFLSADRYALFAAIYAAINEPEGLAMLNASTAWQKVPVAALETSW